LQRHFSPFVLADFLRSDENAFDDSAFVKNWRQFNLIPAVCAGFCFFPFQAHIIAIPDAGGDLKETFPVSWFNQCPEIVADRHIYPASLFQFICQCLIEPLNAIAAVDDNVHIGGQFV